MIDTRRSANFADDRSKKMEATKHGDELAASKVPKPRTPFVGVHVKETASELVFFRAFERDAVKIRDWSARGRRVLSS